MDGKTAILLVEDQAIIAMAESRSLARNGYEVSVARSGEEAVALVAGGAKVDIVLMDVDLGPGMDGPEAARRILALRDLPLVFLSAHTEPQVVESTEGISSYGYIVKNSGETVLLASIRMAFRLFAARQELRDQESHYHSLFEHFFGPVWIEDFSRLRAELRDVAARPGVDLRAWIEEYPERLYELADHVTVLDLNQAAKAVIGLGKGDPVPSTLRAFLGPEAKLFFTDELCAIAAGGRSFECVVPVAGPAGETEYFLLHLDAVKGHEEDMSRVQVLLVDISASTEARKRLRILSLAVDQNPSSIVIVDREGIILYANAKCLEITGYTLEEVAGKTPRIFKSGETPEEVYRELWAGICAGHEWRGEFHNRRKDGSLYWESATISPIRDEAGRITHFVGIKEDVTRRKELEAALAESEARFRLSEGGRP